MRMTERLRTLFGRADIYQVFLTPESFPIVEGLTARQLYATQSNLYDVVSFLADSVAQLPLKVYIRNEETERERDRNSITAKLLWRPNADQTAYEFIYALMVEYLLMGSTIVWLLPDIDSASGYQLRVIPKEWVIEEKGHTNFAPDSVAIMSGTGGRIELFRKEFVMFRMYSPGNPGGSISPISALRQTLNEQIQADRFRTEIWSSSGRFNAYIQRPKDVQPWDNEARNRFVTAFHEAWGKGGSKAGRMPVLEDGMEIKSYQFNAKEAQYVETKQLSREDVAAAYHINPSLIWHTTTQTYASAKDNARALYADCLGPILQMIQQRLNSFLLPMLGADPNTYVEFDLTEKLKGSFEERASILQSAVGGPYMTRNEARADNNLPPINGGDELIVPLNVVEGGQASPKDTHMDPKKAAEIETKEHPEGCGCHHHKAATEPEPETVTIRTGSTEDEDSRMSDIFAKFFKRQTDSILPKIGAGTEWWDEERWNTELADDIEPVMDDIADKHGQEIAEKLGTEYSTEQTRAWIRKCAEGRAHAINSTTKKRIEAAIESEDEEDTPAHAMETREKTDSERLGGKLARDIAGWAALHEAIQQAQQQGFDKKVEKRWITGANPRPEHAAMNGETVDIDAKFSNGCEWPGDDLGDPDTTCGCNCVTEVIITF